MKLQDILGKDGNITIPAQVESWTEVGNKIGAAVASAMAAGEKLARNVAITFGEKLAGQPSAGDFLTGYASGWENPNTAKSRKTEMKAVFDAFSIGNETRRMLVSYDEGGGAVYGEKPIIEWLKGHNEISIEVIKGKPAKLYTGYSGLVKLAKKLRGTAEATSTTATATRAAKLTDKQFGEFVERLPGASAAQSAQLVEKAIGQLVVLPGFEVAYMRQVVNIANIIKAKSKDEAAVKVASGLLDAAQEYIDATSKAEKERLVQQGAAARITAPTPAVVPVAQPAAEVSKAA